MTITDFVFLPWVASIVRPSFLAWETSLLTGAESGLTIAMIFPALTILPNPHILHRKSDRIYRSLDILHLLTDLLNRGLEFDRMVGNFTVIRL